MCASVTGRRFARRRETDRDETSALRPPRVMSTRTHSPGPARRPEREASPDHSPLGHGLFLVLLVVLFKPAALSPQIICPTRLALAALRGCKCPHQPDLVCPLEAKVTPTQRRRCLTMHPSPPSDEATWSKCTSRARYRARRTPAHPARPASVGARAPSARRPGNTPQNSPPKLTSDHWGSIPRSPHSQAWARASLP